MNQGRHAAWSASLQRVASSRLEFCPDLPEIAGRWDAWWRFEADRPLLRLAVPANPSIRWDHGFDLLDKPAEWVALRRRQVESTYRVGDEIPCARVNLGPVAVAAFLGAPLLFAAAEQTSWQDPIIQGWTRPPSFRIDAGNPWFRRVVALGRALAEDAAGRYMVSMPDMAGAIDVLANMRGTELLCMDLYENREPIKAAALEVAEAIDDAFSTLYETVLSRGAGITTWLNCWSNTPYTVTTCDFSALIGPGDFSEVCLPSLREQARRAGRSIFHLDGPAAARHAEMVASDDTVGAIQYVNVPAKGAPSGMEKAPMLRRIQEARKPVLITCSWEDVEPLCDALDPRGLAFMPWGVTTPALADRLFSTVESRYRSRRENGIA